MKKYLFLIFTCIVFGSQLKAEVINEYMNDIYFANGINTSKFNAQKQLDELILEEVSITQFNGDFQKMKQSVDFKLAYNNTLGIAFDLLESYNQKQAEHGTFWWVLGVSYDVAGSLAGHAAKEVTKEFSSFQSVLGGNAYENTKRVLRVENTPFVNFYLL